MKKCLLITLFIMCIGFFMPQNVKAFEFLMYNSNINYRFFVDEDDANKGTAHFTLHDLSGTISYDSLYDSNTNSYYFINSNNEYEVIDYSIIPFDCKNELDEYNSIVYVLWDALLNGFMEKYDNVESYSLIVPSELPEQFNSLRFYIPLVLETNTFSGTSPERKIVFAVADLLPSYLFASLTPRTKYVLHINLVNNTYMFENNNFLNNSTEVITKMRRTVLDYNEDIIDRLNDGSLSWSELSDMSNDYKNRSIITNEYNVQEESISDLANSFPVLNFGNRVIDKADNNLISNVVNPKTFTNGIIIISILVLIVFSSCLIINKKKKV